MKVLPDPEHARPVAIGLFAIALVLVYLAGFHWFIQRHAALGEQIESLQQQVGRFKGIVAQREPLRERLARLRAERMDSALFLAGSDFNIAAAELISSLREWVQSQANDPELCSIINTSPRRPREPERFQSVHVNVRMQCPLDDFTRVLHAMESAVPVVFVDDVMINQRLTLSQRGRSRRSQYGQLDIRFDMYGYLDQPGASEEE